jgi:predicted permease
MVHALLSRIIGSLRRERLDAECDQEVQEHLEMLAERFMAQGLEPAEAHYAALRQFGGVTQMKEELRERRALPPWDVLAQDVRHALRGLWNAKGFTASAAMTLALGIGASTAVFAVLDTVVLRPLPFADADRLMSFRNLDRRGSPHPTNLSYPNFFDYRAQNRVFEHLVCYRDSRFTLTDSLPPIQEPGEIVSWDLFPLLGVQPELGRGFLPEEEKAGAHVVVLSHQLWQSRFGADRGIVGRQIRINGKAFTVAGVAPRGFQFPEDAPPMQLWTTLAEDAAETEATPLTEQRGARVTDSIGRLRRGVTPAQAQTQMDQIGASLALLDPDNNKNVAKTLVMPELERLVGTSRRTLWILFGAVMLVLLIGCANVANLLLVRSTGRTREFALRTALGASRRALVRQLLAESLVLGSLGTIGGVLLSVLALRLVLPMAGDSIAIPRLAQASVDIRVLAFSIAAALATVLLFSLAPAAQVMRVDVAGALKEAAASIAPGRHRLRNSLVVGQITLGLVLLVGAELLIASFVYLARRDPGFRPDHLLTFGVGLSETRYDVAGQGAFSDRLRKLLRAIPGVKAVAAGLPLPLEGNEMTVSFDIEERRAPAPERPSSDMAIVTPDFFRTMGIPIRKGRDFTERDDARATRVLIVNQAFARTYFPGEDAIGKRVEPGGTNIGEKKTMMREIVGIVGNATQSALEAEATPIYYFPYKQLSWDIGTFVVRSAIPPEQIEQAARNALMSLDKEAPMFQVRTGEERAARAIAVPRFLTILMSGFAGIAVLLTVVGLYGVLSYTVTRRRREIGVRMALGADRGAVVALVLKDAMKTVAVGLALGVAGAAAVQRLLGSIAFGIRPGDPMFTALACGVMIVASLAAAYLPALRAALMDPTQTLRNE